MARYSEQSSHPRRKSTKLITEKQIVEYIAKKSEKKAMKVAKKLKMQAISGYSNCSNPFGDSNLGENFVWRKKIERDVVRGRSLDISVKAEKRRRKERMAELEKVKKRREERALEKARHEEEMALLARERIRAEYQDWEKREEEVMGSVVSKLELNTVKQMEELGDDIKMHLDMDRATQTHIDMGAIMEEEEGEMALGCGEEVKLNSELCWWHEKYRPRKPKYLNRVQTGYEWNKYNQSHYDKELNPPPEVVQGYKFNLFYPELVDKSKAPTYSITKEKEEDGMCVLRFHAGPPYEDIAFRIVDREWDCSQKGGFKCTFEQGILRLNMKLKRHRSTIQVAKMKSLGHCAISRGV